MKSNKELFHQVIDEKTQRPRVTAVVSETPDLGLHSTSEVPGFTKRSSRKKICIAFGKEKPGISGEDLSNDVLRMFPDASNVYQEMISGFERPNLTLQPMCEVPGLTKHNSRQRCIKRSSSYQQQEMNSGLVHAERPNLRLHPMSEVPRLTKHNSRPGGNVSDRLGKPDDNSTFWRCEIGSLADGSLRKPVSVTKSEATPRVLPHHRGNLGPPSNEEEMNEEEFDMKEKAHHLNNTKSAPNASSSVKKKQFGEIGSLVDGSLQNPVSVTKSEATPRVFPHHRCNLGPPSSEEEMSEEFDMKEMTPPRTQYPRLLLDQASAVMEIEDYYKARYKKKLRVDLNTKGKVKLWEAAAKKPG